MEILHPLLQIDQQLFLWLNTHVHTPWLDTFFVVLTTKENWVLPLLIVAGIFGFRRRQEAFWIMVVLIMGVAMADQLSSGILKPWVERLRPCKTLEGFRLLIPCGGRWSFPSSHAANAAAVATVLWWYAPRWCVGWAILAGLIGYSRIYVGVHYPFDVLGGWMVGGIAGIVTIYLARWGFIRFNIQVKTKESR